MTENIYTIPEPSATSKVLSEIHAERENQDARWGEQNHPSSGDNVALFAKKADHWKQINDARATMETLTWDGILLEEVFEALSEIDPLLRREELLQVAAVAAAEVECIDRLLASEDSPYAEKADDWFESGVAGEPELDKDAA